MNHKKIASAAGQALLATLVALAAVGPARAAGNILVNGGFESGSFSGWTTTGDTAFAGVQCSGAGPTVAEGACSAFLGTVLANGTLSQTFATTTGSVYQLTFAGLFTGDAPSSFAAAVNGQTLLAFTNPLTTTYQNFAVSFTATGASTTLRFTFRDDPGFEYLDNVSVSAVPEPASVALLAAGLGLVAWSSTANARKGSGQDAGRRVRSVDPEQRIGDESVT